METTTNEKVNMVKLIEQMGERIVKDNNCYTFDNGSKVPRVTKVLERCIHDNSLMYWANSLGFKHMSYKQTLDAAANIGSVCHHNIDQFLEDDKYEVTNLLNPIEATNAYYSFLKWYNQLCATNQVKVLLKEHTLVCNFFGGTLDGLYEINGKKYIVDYKTSNYVKFNHFLQVAAYRYMLRNVMNIEVDGCIILQLSKQNYSYNQFLVDATTPEGKQFLDDCESCFLSLVFAYYNINRVEDIFNNYKW